MPIMQAWGNVAPCLEGKDGVQPNRRLTFCLCNSAFG